MPAAVAVILIIVALGWVVLCVVAGREMKQGD